MIPTVISFEWVTHSLTHCPGFGVHLTTQKNRGEPLAKFIVMDEYSVEVHRNKVLICPVNIFPLYRNYLLSAFHPLFQFLPHLKDRQLFRLHFDFLA